MRRPVQMHCVLTSQSPFGAFNLTSQADFVRSEVAARISFMALIGLEADEDV
jgi:hypothetical protein